MTAEEITPLGNWRVGELTWRFDGRVLRADDTAIGTVLPITRAFPLGPESVQYLASDDRHRITTKHDTLEEACAAVLDRVRARDRKTAEYLWRANAIARKQLALVHRIEAGPHVSELVEIVKLARELQAEADQLVKEIEG